MLIKLATDKTVSETAAALQVAVQADHFGVMQVHNLQATMVTKGVEFARTKEKKRQEQEMKSYASSQDSDLLRHGAVGARLRGNRAMEHVARISVMIRNVGMAMLVVALAGCSGLRNPAKASVATGAMEEFDSLPDLFRTLIPDEKMRQRDLPPERTAAEERNVAVNVWVYAATRSFDGDYHMVLGSAPELPAQFMTAEVKRAPSRSVDLTKTLATREQFRAIFGHPACGESTRGSSRLCMSESPVRYSSTLTIPRATSGRTSLPPTPAGRFIR